MIETFKPTVKLSTLAEGPFGCCSSWQVCEMGKKPCMFLEEDPEYAALCACHKRYERDHQESKQEKQPEPFVHLAIEEKKETINETFFSFDSNGQGMLF